MTRLSIEKGRKPCATQAPDPRRRKSKDNELDVEGQTNLLQHGYSIAGLTSLTGPTPSRGRPVSVHKTYRFENCISTINGKTLDEVAKSTGWFIEWVCHVDGTNFEWDFGRKEYEYLYLGLEEYEDMGKQIFPKDGPPFPVRLPSVAKAAFERHTVGDEDMRRKAAAEVNDDDDADDDEGAPPWESLEAVDRSQNKVNEQTRQYFQQIVDEMTSGARPAYGPKWPDFTVRPPHWTRTDPPDPDAMLRTPVAFWDPNSFWGDRGLEHETPCVYGGWSHKQYVKKKSLQWQTPRLVKDANGAHMALTFRRFICVECERNRRQVKTSLKHARDEKADESVIKDLEARLKASSCYFSSVDPRYTKLLGERYPFVALGMAPASPLSIERRCVQQRRPDALPSQCVPLVYILGRPSRVRRCVDFSWSTPARTWYLPQARQWQI